MSNEWKPYFDQKRKERQLKCEEAGYYLVRASDGKRFFISREIDVDALGKVAEEVLTYWDYDYWIDRLLEPIWLVDGNKAWVNVDYTDSFF